MAQGGAVRVEPVADDGAEILLDIAEALNAHGGKDSEALALEVLEHRAGVLPVVAVGPLPVRVKQDGSGTHQAAHLVKPSLGVRLDGFQALGPAFDEVYPISALDDVLPRTKILVMALPSTPETVHILNRERIALLPADACVINVGRGTALDQKALAEALNSGKLAGAALDVMDPEPLPQDDPLWDARNIILTPHVSGNMTLGYTCDENVARFCADLENYAAGRPLAGLVDRNRGY